MESASAVRRERAGHTAGLASHLLFELRARVDDDFHSVAHRIREMCVRFCEIPSDDARGLLRADGTGAVASGIDLDFHGCPSVYLKKSIYGNSLLCLPCAIVCGILPNVKKGRSPWVIRCYLPGKKLSKNPQHQTAHSWVKEVGNPRRSFPRDFSQPCMLVLCERFILLIM